MKRDVFAKIFNSVKENHRNDVSNKKCIVNGTSESVLKHLRELADEDVMEKAVSRLENNMYDTFSSVVDVEKV